MSIVLAIETSCDETAVAIVNNRKVLGNVVASQIDIHREFGGVVPEVASRHHLESINACIDTAFEQSGLDWSEIEAIATTCAPGLVGALLVGAAAGKTLAMVHQKPFIGVHHLEGHIYASYLSQPELEPPFLCLLVSGGHTSFIEVRGCGEYELLGETRDDAAGEAFDKVARLLKVGYPGGPVIDRLAKEGDPQAFKLPEGRISLPGGGYHPYDCSFSGLKTAVLRLVQQFETEGKDVPVEDIAASFQYTVAQALTKRAVRCAGDRQLQTIVVGGGVAANSGLRQILTAAAAEAGIRVYFPPLKFCTDNAAMIACAAAEHFQRSDRSPLDLPVASRLPITQVQTLYS
ncbi:tRNA N6-adenosine(37)-threonylcarbamoyltransferase complex transferase subunit TsaD [Picosynechococcus sp. PCC 7003]|uniref:tRNA (adenosine(37)-N6)-threonylcarbamoyltransferase complex transferase subunit TsaD n=1 Tax=Picosynechococcus sp. PCC 7003 TaxID=374981 RepID=UPI0008105FA6|nr:tRNA (adenosine(37)-N6)-threonylcarbamoyltransferase complex transferase subunit TsaD [Picosynechococcus sp. PCC 7003]ANV83722.1 tRNA N6-adenosine(37)-threonylcarbamoyltransferase complex transferase subunit TsaD [Picosynechococcus sp. PCC 7003]